MPRANPLSPAEFEAAYRVLCDELRKLGIRIEGGEPGDDRRSHHFRDHMAKMWCAQQPVSDGGYVLGHDQPRYGKIYPMAWFNPRVDCYVEVTNFTRQLDVDTTNHLNAAIAAALVMVQAA